MREAEGSAASAVKEAAKANADAVAARQAESAAKEEGRRHELQVTELKVTVAAKEEYLQILQKDRERLRDPKSRGASTVNSPKAEGDRPGEVAALQKQLEASEARCKELTAQAEAASGRAAEASESARLASLECANAKAAASSATTALSRQTSLAADHSKAAGTMDDPMEGVVGEVRVPQRARCFIGAQSECQCSAGDDRRIEGACPSPAYAA